MGRVNLVRNPRFHVNITDGWESGFRTIDEYADLVTYTGGEAEVARLTSIAGGMPAGARACARFRVTGTSGSMRNIYWCSDAIAVTPGVTSYALNARLGQTQVASYTATHRVFGYGFLEFDANGDMCGGPSRDIVGSVGSWLWQGYMTSVLQPATVSIRFFAWYVGRAPADLYLTQCMIGADGGTYD